MSIDPQWLQNTTCYNRIVRNVGGFIARAHGNNRSILFINGNTFKNDKYVLKTKLGVSEGLCNHSQLFPIYGSGQGAGNSPSVWCCISSIAFECYESKDNGAQFYSPDQQIKCQIFMVPLRKCKILVPPWEVSGSWGPHGPWDPREPMGGEPYGIQGSHGRFWIRGNPGRMGGAPGNPWPMGGPPREPKGSHGRGPLGTRDH